MTAWSTTGTQRPLQERWDAVAAKMIEAGQTPINPISEETVFRMKEFLKAQPPRVPEPDSPSMAAATEAFSLAVEAYERVRDGILADQKLLKRGDKRVHAILHKVSDDMMAPPPPAREMLLNLSITQSFDIRYMMPRGWPIPRFATVADGRRAASLVQLQVMNLEAISASLRDAFNFECIALPEQNRQLIFALASRLGALEDRTLALEQRNEELEQKLRERATKPRKGKQRHG